MSQKKFGIVVGVDFSETGDLALREAMRSARERFHSEIHVVHVVTEDEVEDADGVTDLERESDAVAKIPARVWDRVWGVGKGTPEGLPHLQVAVHVRLGPPAAAIHQVAIDYDADLIVVGTHGRRGIRKLMLGSVAAELVEKARCSLMVVRAKDFEGAERSPVVEPAIPGEDLRRDRGRRSHVYHSSTLLNWSKRPTDVEGWRF